MSSAELDTPVRSPLRRLTGVQIIGTGSYVPENVVTNDALASLGCDADWILQRTGIRQRRHAPKGTLRTQAAGFTSLSAGGTSSPAAGRATV